MGGKIGRTVLAASVVAVCLATSASAASASEVLLTEGGKGVRQHEGVYIYTELIFAGVGTCYATDEGGFLGKNPSATLKATGSKLKAAELDCIAEGLGTTNGTQTVKGVSVAANGAVKASIAATIEAHNTCKYEIKTLKGVTGFGGPFDVSVSGAAKLEKGTENPPSCAKSTSVSGEVSLLTLYYGPNTLELI